MKKQPKLTKEQKLQQQLIELVLNLTDGYCDLSKYSFNDESFARFQLYISNLITQAEQQERTKLLKWVLDEVIDFIPEYGDEYEINAFRAEQRKKIEKKIKEGLI